MKQLILALLLLTCFSARAQSAWTLAMPITDLNGVMDVATDTDGNIHITGRFWGTLQLGTTQLSSPNLCLYIAKCRPTGEVLQVVQLPGDDDVLPRSISVDKDGNRYVTGSFRGQLTYNTDQHFNSQTVGSGSDVFLLKCAANGSVRWIRQVQGTNTGPGGGCSGQGVAVDPAGNTYVTGTVNGSNVQIGTLTFGARQNQAFLASYNRLGDLRWAKVWSPLTPAPPISQSRGGGVAVDNNGNCYVSGSCLNGWTLGSTTVTTANSLFVGKFTASNGQLQWARTPAADGDGRGVATTKQGDVYVGGSFTGSLTLGPSTLTSAGDADGIVIRYNPQGNVVWARALGGPNYDTVGDLAIDQQSGKAFAAGMMNFTASSTNQFYWARLATNGTVQQQETVAGPGTSSGNTLAIDGDNNIYSIGVFSGSCGFGPLALTSGSTQAFLSRYGSISTTPSAAAFSIFPNPASAQLTLRLTNPTLPSRAQLYNQMGVVVATRVIQPTSPVVDVNFNTGALPNGLYFLLVEYNGAMSSHQVVVQH
jgi:hypothetical protein